MTKAASRVIVDEPGRLHERVADRRADEFEAAPEQIFAERVRVLRSARQVLQRPWTVHQRRTTDETPDVGVEGSELLLDGEEGLRIAHGAFHLQAVADDAFVREQPLNAGGRKSRHLDRVEARKRLAAALENGKEIYGRVRDRAVEGAKVADKTVRENPYQAIAIGVGVGALVGYLLGRRCSRD